MAVFFSRPKYWCMPVERGAFLSALSGSATATPYRHISSFTTSTNRCVRWFYNGFYRVSKISLAVATLLSYCCYHIALVDSFITVIVLIVLFLLVSTNNLINWLLTEKSTAVVSRYSAVSESGIRLRYSDDVHDDNQADRYCYQYNG